MRTFFAATVALWAAVFPQTLIAESQAGLTPERVNQRIEALQATGAANPEVLAAYESVRSWLDQAASFDRDAASYLQALTSAPERGAEAQRRLDRLEADAETDASSSALSQTTIEADLATARFEFTQASNALGALERQLAARESNAALVRTRLGAVMERLAESPETGVAVEPDAPPSMAEATQWLGAAEYAALRAEQKALEARLASQPARYSVMQIERAEANILVERLKARVRHLESSITSLPGQPAPMPLDMATSSPVYSLAMDLRSEDEALQRRVESIRAQVNDLRTKTGDIEASARALGDRFATARRVVEFAGESESLGSALMAYWREIDTYRNPGADRALSRDIGNAVINRIRHEEDLATLVSAAGFVNQALADLGIEPERVTQTNRLTLMKLASANRARLAELIAAESEYIEVLRTLDAAHENLAALIGEYETFLGGLIIWVPSHEPLWQMNLTEISRELRSLRGQVSILHMASPPPTSYGMALVALLLMLARGRLRAYQHVLTARISRPSEDSVRFTFMATLTVLVRALPAALLVMIIGDLLVPSVPADAISATANALASVLYVLLLLRITCEESGLGNVHFGWPASTCDRVVVLAGRLLSWWLPVATAATLILSLQSDLNDAVLGRMLFLLATILLATPIIRALLQRSKQNAVRQLSALQRRSGLAVLAVLALVAGELVLGHLYSLNLVDNAMVETLWVGIVLLFLHAVLMRGLRVTRRRARLAELMAAREQKQAGEEASAEDEEVDLGELSTETAQLLNVGAIAAITGSLLYIWSPLLPAFETLEQYVLWTTTSTLAGEVTVVRVTLATLLLAIFLVAATFFAAGRLPSLVELLVRSRTDISAGARYTIKTLLSYVIVGAGTVTALATLGLKWSQLQWLIAALGVGIGFGLQEIVANFISGLIILFERPIRVGDIVTVGDQEGTVMRIRIRATTIRNWDGKELLVPNKEFITGRLLNWSLSDPTTRLIIRVGIAYGSDVTQALGLVREVVSGHPRVLAEPPPSIIFEQFGNDSLELSARVFIDSIDERMAIGSEIREVIYARLREAGIVIAFPQRDVHLDSVGPIRIVVDEA